MGAEIGNSTQKLHARGPIGMRELCTYKYVVEGDGHVRPRPLDPTRRDPRRHLQPAAHRPPALRPGGAGAARARPRAADAGQRAAAKEAIEGDPGREHRLELCRLAVERRRAARGLGARGRARRDRRTPSIRWIHCDEPDPEDELTFIVGGDMAASLPRWREPERVLELAHVRGRRARGDSDREVIASAVAGLRGGAGLEFFDMPRIDVSSTEVRRRVAAGGRSATWCPTRWPSTSAPGALPGRSGGRPR